MKTMIEFMKKEAVFSIALVLTVFSMFFVLPNKGYVDYIDFKVLALLFCLMSVVEGFKKIGIFDVISCSILSKTKNSRTIGILLSLICFFTAMLVTNDVALITFVPLTFILLGDNDDEKDVIFIIVMETIAANLGSMVTPIGNPQNLYLYSYYDMDMGRFLETVLPYGVISLILIVVFLWIRLKKSALDIEVKQTELPDKKKIVKYVLIFLLCLSVVLKICDYRICLGIILAVLLVSDREILKKVDYVLLLTFVCFFVFVGNIGSMEGVRKVLSTMVEGRTLVAGVILSQIISNVPAAVMLSGFTEDAQGLILGTDIGGLGTLVASLASLISYKFYVKKYPKNVGKYIRTFTIWNVLFLIILLGVAQILRHMV